MRPHAWASALLLAGLAYVAVAALLGSSGLGPFFYAYATIALGVLGAAAGAILLPQRRRAALAAGLGVGACGYAALVAVSLRAHGADLFLLGDALVGLGFAQAAWLARPGADDGGVRLALGLSAGAVAFLALLLFAGGWASTGLALVVAAAGVGGAARAYEPHGATPIS